MQWVQRQRLDTPVEALRALVRDPARLGSSLPARALELDGTEVALVLDGPRPVRLRLACAPTAGGVRYELVQGDVTALAVRIEAEPADEGTLLTLELTLDPGVVVPGPLLRELEQEVLPRWIASLGGGS